MAPKLRQGSFGAGEYVALQQEGHGVQFDIERDNSGTTKGWSNALRRLSLIGAGK